MLYEYTLRTLFQVSTCCHLDINVIHTPAATQYNAVLSFVRHRTQPVDCSVCYVPTIDSCGGSTQWRKHVRVFVLNIECNVTTPPAVVAVVFTCITTMTPTGFVSLWAVTHQLIVHASCVELFEFVRLTFF